MQAAESSENVTLKNGWTTVLSEKAVIYQVGDRMNYLGRKVSLSDRGDVTIPNRDSYLHVSMDDGKVASGEEKLLYSTEFGSCIAVLGRVFKKDEEAVSYTCLHHVFMYPQKLNKTLKELADKAGKVARIQFFISGGQKQSEELLAEVREISFSKIDSRLIAMLQESIFCGINKSLTFNRRILCRRENYQDTWL